MEIKNKTLSISKQITYQFDGQLLDYDLDYKFYDNRLKKILELAFEEFCDTKDKEKFVNFLNVLSTIKIVEDVFYYIDGETYTKEDFLLHIENNLEKFEN